MKLLKITAFVVVVLFFSTKVNAQTVMASKAVWVTIKSENLRCWTCRELLDKYLVKQNKFEFEGGIIEWRFNLLAGEIKFRYLPDRVNVDDLRVTLNNAGFDADTTKAVAETYAKLPPICKRPADGGGPTKGNPCHMEPY
jgi:hypothetical protein